MFSMPIVDLLAEGRKLADTGRRVSVLWQHADTLVFLARGREYRSEFHINPSDETMQMIKGDMRLHYRTPEGKEEVALIQEGAIIYTPAGTPIRHASPRTPLRSSRSASAVPARSTASNGFASNATRCCTKKASSSKTTLSTPSQKPTSASSTARNSAPAKHAARSCPRRNRSERFVFVKRERGFARQTLNF